MNHETAYAILVEYEQIQVDEDDALVVEYLDQGEEFFGVDGFYERINLGEKLIEDWQEYMAIHINEIPYNWIQ